ncbi:MAG: Asp-tRNA(Asn)/Glu-tRNA(Gln) amidotransferase subunit GatA [Ruminococcaceae bacterium]|nr:Asp-tRNA(Asn)/Glu-tRNA(Gln) amidotransferase subunit GatA [Oscillospiraceae bacterium]
MDIAKMTALELGKAIKNKEISVKDAVLSVFDAIEKKDKDINAYVSLCKEEAIKKADEIQKKIDDGSLSSPIAGVPVSIKDNICTKGIKTTCSSKILGDFKPPYNATVIEKLENAGAIVIGKLNMDEFAMGSTSETSYYGPTKNPWDLNKVPGGSSGGAAAAVAADEAIFSLGSDTGGSIRQPASYCGVTGFKPTYGTVSRYGLIAYASSLDQIGPIAKDVKDCAAIMDIISGKDKFDGTSLDNDFNSLLDSLNGDVKGMKIGLPKECFETEGLDASVKESVLNVADKLKELGATVEEISLPFIDYVIPAYYIIASAEASSNLSRFDGVKYGFRAENIEGINDLYCATRSEGFGSEVKKRILLGTFVLSSGYYDAYYQKALKVKAIIKKHFDEVFEKYDLIICPTAPTTAPEIGKSLSDPLKMYLSDIFTVSVNIAGLPGLNVPCGFDKNNMPIGAQIIGQRLSEKKVLNAGYAYQQNTDYHKMKAEVK